MKNWIRQKLQSFLYLDNSIGLEPINIIDNDGVEFPDPLTFKIQRANGGHIVEVRHYSRDERYVAIHIIPEEQNLQESISKILTYESLKK